MCKTITQKVKFRASPEQVYQFLADSKLHTKITGERAEISCKIGGQFSTRNGCVSGINVDLVPGKRVVQAWRTEAFPEGIFSMVTVQLIQTNDGGTELKLTHRGVPKHLIPDIEREWREIYWSGIRQQVLREGKNLNGA
jgi:uncharacterized protein YndB with AHSA1/START domain